jgi:SAM-dependent methyltransferase
VTLNRLGRTSTELNEVSGQFVNFCEHGASPVLDIGAAFGVASLAALNVGTRVIANDIDTRHLAEIARRAPRHLRNRLALYTGRFPDETDFMSSSLMAVHASNLFNFLTGEEIERGIRKIMKWLKPEGRVFVIAGTPYAANVKHFVPEFERRLGASVRWPGWVEDIRMYSDDPTLAELPPSLHLLDAETLRVVFETAGFTVESAGMFARAGIPDYLKLDGRENVQLLARK